jgi:hypothetical protein
VAGCCPLLNEQLSAALAERALSAERAALVEGAAAALLAFAREAAACGC